MRARVPSAPVDDANESGVEEAAAVDAAVVSDSAHEGNTNGKKSTSSEPTAEARSDDGGHEVEGVDLHSMDRQPANAPKRTGSERGNARENMRDVVAVCNKCIADGLDQGTCHKRKSRAREASSTIAPSNAKRRRR